MDMDRVEGIVHGQRRKVHKDAPLYRRRTGRGLYAVSPAAIAAPSPGYVRRQSREGNMIQGVPVTVEQIQLLPLSG